MNSKAPKVKLNITKTIEVTPFQQEVEKAKAAAQAKVEELKPTHGKVYPLVLSRPDTQQIFVGFIKEPTRAAKMEAFDIMTTKESLSLAGEMILNSSLIVEESHEAFSLIDDPRYDDVYMGACIDCMGHIKVLMNSLKKS